MSDYLPGCALCLQEPCICEADAEQPSVDWLDGRESCLIDGVRYRRAGSSEVEKLLAGWERDGFATGPAKLLRAAVEADQREGREGDVCDSCDAPVPDGKVFRLCEECVEALPDLPEGAVPEGYEERWAIRLSGGRLIECPDQEAARRMADRIGHSEVPERIFVAPGPEEGGET